MYKTPTFCFSYTCRIISGTSQNHKNPNLWERGGGLSILTCITSIPLLIFLILSSTPPPPRMLRVWDMRQNGISLSILINTINICIIFTNLWLCFLYIDSLQSLSLFPRPRWSETHSTSIYLIFLKVEKRMNPLNVQNRTQ